MIEGIEEKKTREMFSTYAMSFYKWLLSFFLKKKRYLKQRLEILVRKVVLMCTKAVSMIHLQFSLDYFNTIFYNKRN